MAFLSLLRNSSPVKIFHLKLGVHLKTLILKFDQPPEFSCLNWFKFNFNLSKFHKANRLGKQFNRLECKNGEKLKTIQI